MKTEFYYIHELAFERIAELREQGYAVEYGYERDYNFDYDVQFIWVSYED